MNNRDIQKIQLEKDDDQKEILKSYEKDIKALASFFIDKNLFIKIHMVYKKVSANCSGAIFIVFFFFFFNNHFLKELAQFYNLLYTSPSCSKLLNHTMKVINFLLISFFKKKRILNIKQDF